MSHAHAPYPQFDIDCFKDTLRIIRGGTVREEAPLFVKCGYTLIGAGLGATIGEPPGPVASRADLHLAECSLEELVEIRDQLLTLEDGHGLCGADEAAIDPATLAIIVQLVLALVNKWINKKSA